MALLEQDTLYYRADHPMGFLFSGGNPAPDPADGWAALPEDIAPLPPRNHECSTLDAYEALLRGERAAGAQAQAAARSLAADLNRALSACSAMAARIVELEADLAEITPNED